MTNSEYELVGEVVRIFRRGKKWYANFQHAGKQHREALKTTSKKEARRRAIQIEAELITGRYKTVTPPPALAVVIANYMQYLRIEGRAKKTLGKYQNVFDTVTALAERRYVATIDGINMTFLDNYRTERVNAGAAAKTVYGESVIIRQLINFALSRDMIQDDPLKGLHLNKPKPTAQPCWTNDEVERILAASAERERMKFTVLADTGMRVGELRWLTWDDVDFARNVLHIRPKDDWKPKTGDQRSIPMTPRVRALLENLPHRGRWVFTARASKRYPRADHQFSDRHLLASLKKVLAKLKLPGHVHTFRHAFISHALTRGVPESIVREWVGHVDAEVMKLYTHIAYAASQTAMQRLAGQNTNCSTEGAGNGVQYHGTDSAHFQHSEGGAKNDHDAA